MSAGIAMQVYVLLKCRMVLNLFMGMMFLVLWEGEGKGWEGREISD